MHRALPSLLVSTALACAALVATVRADTVYLTSRSTGRLLTLDSTLLPVGSGTFTVSPTVSGTGLNQSAGLAIGSDGKLYAGDAGDGDTVDPSIKRFTFTTGSTGSFTTAVSLPQLAGNFPTTIAFRPQNLGGEMLVGRYGPGAVLKVTDWQTTGSASDYTASLNSSIALAVAADGTLYVGNNTIQPLPSPPGSIAVFGPIVKFDATGGNQQTVANDGSPTGLYGPTGLVLAGSTLYSASVMNGSLFQTDLANLDPSTNTSFFGTTGSPFDVGALARLSNGDFLTGNSAGTNLLYRFNSSGSLIGIYESSDFGVIGGIAVQAVPEPASLTLAALGIAAAAFAWRRRRPSRTQA
jgi:hypothetical protein